MAIYAHILSIFMVIVVLICTRGRLYKKDPWLYFCLLFSLGGLLLLSLVSMIFPSDKFDAMTCIIFGCVLFVCCMYDIYRILRCKEKIKGVYCDYCAYRGGVIIKTFAPIFKYTYNQMEYRLQTTQNYSYKRLRKKFIPGNVYDLYVNAKHPSAYIIER